MLKTMAMKITEHNYDVAVSCLSAGFIQVPRSKPIGCYLVINEVDAVVFKNSGDRPWLVVVNSWMSAEIFGDMYDWVDFETDNMFVEVRRK